MKRSIVILLSSVFISIFMASSNCLAAEKLRIATLSPISGAAASWGIAVLRGCELAAEKINNEGGVKIGNDWYLIELVKGDTKANPDAALSEVNRLIFKEKVKYIVGPNVSSSTLAILPVTEKEKVLVASFSYSSEVLGKDRKYSFRLYPAGREYMSAIFTYIREHRPEIKKVALIGPNDQSGWDNAKAARSMAE